MSEVGMRSISEKETTEVPKHRKKKQSSTSKARTKSKHRHIYKDCLFINNKVGWPYKGQYCIFCGKIGEIDLFEAVKVSGGYRRRLIESEIIEKYKYLEKIEIEDFSQKHIK